MLLVSIPALSAQAMPFWQAANAIKDQFFQVQKAMFAAQRADDPADSYAAAAETVDEAVDLYNATLAPQLTPFPAVDQAIADAFDAAHTAASTGDALSLAAARGRLWTTMLWASYEATLTALENGEVESVGQWLQLREYRHATKVTIIDDASTQAMLALEAGEIEAPAALTTISADLRDAYFFRLREALNQLEEAVEESFPTRAAEWAGQARGYFNILHGDFAAKLGDSPAAAVEAELAALETATINEDWSSISGQLEEIRAGLADYQPVQLDLAEVEKRGQLLYTFTDLIYVEYKDGVRNGEITIAIEYQEAQTFLDQAHAVFEEVRPVIAANDPAAAERITELFDEMAVIMDDLGPVPDIETRVQEALSLIETNLEIEAGFNDTESALLVINTLLDEMTTAVREGRYEDAERTRLEAYAMFENGMEQRLANRAVLMTRELEGLFWEGTGGEKGLATLLREEAPATDIEADVVELKQKLDEAQTFLSAGLTGFFAFLNSLAIIIREGLEAVLIIGAILGYMRATKAPRKYSLWTYVGVVAAIALSLFTWWAAANIITITVANRELIEGVTSLIAAAVLFYVTNWLFHKVYVVDWMTFVKEQVSKAVSTGSALGLAALGFTVVYREGFETVLFYQALLFDAETAPVLAGFVVGLIIIVIVAYAILSMSKRLPLKPFFTITGALLLFLAFNFIGAGIRELQEAGQVSATLLPWMPENLFLMEIFGIFPTVETTVAQALFLALVVATFVYSKWQGQRNVVKQTAMSGSR
ncbi:MAG: FTR1 family iron permease [Anaerolineae bacterium]|nr:FTR1 family iron permease [Anaerolineae bacterium]